MRRLVSVLMIPLLLALGACGSETGGESQKILAHHAALEWFAWNGTLRVDYGDRVLDFGLECETEGRGGPDERTRMRVTSPELLRGVSATLTGQADPSTQKASLEYEGLILETGKLPGTGLSPLELVPLMQEQWAGGYVIAETAERLKGETVRRVSFSKGNMEITAWFASDRAPLICEVSADGVLVARLTVDAFSTGSE